MAVGGKESGSVEWGELNGAGVGKTRDSEKGEEVNGMFSKHTRY
jgi:hypothetical protein